MFVGKLILNFFVVLFLTAAPSFAAGGGDNYVKDYKSIYGENTIVLIQLGSFFEMCSDIDNNNDIGEKNIHTICDNVLDIAVGKKYYKTKNDVTGIAEQKDYLMAGFPLISQGNLPVECFKAFYRPIPS